MSYDLDLCDPVTGKVIESNLAHNFKGGTYALGEITTLSLNVTYNYSAHFDSMGPRGIREIYGKTGAEALSILQKAIFLLGDDVDDNYWNATEGNAKKALIQLAVLSMMGAEGVWRGD